MTTLDEELHAMDWARTLLFRLTRPTVTPRVPFYIREEARRITKHFPGEIRVKIIGDVLRGKE